MARNLNNSTIIKLEGETMFDWPKMQTVVINAKAAVYIQTKTLFLSQIVVKLFQILQERQ